MKLNFTTLGTALLVSLFAPTIEAFQRRILSPSNGIGQEIKKEHANGNFKPKFTLVGDVVGTDLQYALDVVEPVPAVTEATTYSENGGAPQPVGARGYTLLVADVSEDDGTIALIKVDKETDEVDGIVHKSTGKPMKFTQIKGNKAKAYEAEDFTPPAWSCGVSHEEETAGRRSLFADDHDHEDHHDHDSDHHDHDHHDHDHDDIEGAMKYVKENLRGSSMRLGKRRKLQGGSYTYQVDIYIEIDQTLVNDNGGILNPNTIDYVNSIFTGANTIYETEIDTHLNVIHIDLNANYDTQTSTSNALTQMRNIYSSKGFNYDNGVNGFDLHHALLSNSLGGGIAYLSVLCNTAFGFGLSASLSGGYRSMSNAVVWDMMVVMHEIGHNFSSGHTHSGYSPYIDSCGCTKDGTCADACPAQLPLSQSTSIMSYCHLCSGGYSNMMYTFGGKYDGSGTRGDINNYVNSNLNGGWNNEPRRVPLKMFEHVSSRGTCTIAPVPMPPTKSPTSSPTAPTTSPTKRPTMSPTVTLNCSSPTTTQQQCVAAPNCKWSNKNGGQCTSVAPSPPSPSPPSPSPPSCIASGSTCPANPLNCCSQECRIQGRKSVCV